MVYELNEASSASNDRDIASKIMGEFLLKGWTMLGPPNICGRCASPLMRLGDITKCVVCAKANNQSCETQQVERNSKIVKKIGFSTPEPEVEEGESIAAITGKLRSPQVPVRLSSPELVAPPSPILRGEKQKKTVHFKDDTRILSNQALHATRALSGHLYNFTQELDNVDPTNATKVGTLSSTVEAIAKSITALIALQHQLKKSE